MTFVMSYQVGSAGMREVRQIRMYRLKVSGGHEKPTSVSTGAFGMAVDALRKRARERRPQNLPFLHEQVV